MQFLATIRGTTFMLLGASKLSALKKSLENFSDTTKLSF